MPRGRPHEGDPLCAYLLSPENPPPFTIAATNWSKGPSNSGVKTLPALGLRKQIPDPHAPQVTYRDGSPLWSFSNRGLISCHSVLVASCADGDQGIRNTRAKLRYLLCVCTDTLGMYRDSHVLKLP